MIKTIILIALINAEEVYTMPSKLNVIEMRKRRGKSDKGRRRGGRGLR